MDTAVDSPVSAVGDHVNRPVPTPRTRGKGKPRNLGVQASRNPNSSDAENKDKPTPKNADANLGKLSVYVPHSLLRKLTVATAAWDKDKSDIVSQSLEKTLACIVYYDKNATKPSDQSLPVTEIGGEAAA
jgi:hypothetical protein